MSTREELAIDLRLKCQQLMHLTYVKASRKEKGGLLGEMAAVTGCNRKYLVGLLGGYSVVTATSWRARAHTRIRRG